MIGFLTPYMAAIKSVLMVLIFVAGFALSSHLSGKKIGVLNEELGGYKETISSMSALITQQNDGISSLRRLAAERDLRTQQAIEEARRLQSGAEETARAILAKRPPSGVDGCTAASNEFDAELRQERRVK